MTARRPSPPVWAFLVAPALAGLALSASPALSAPSVPPPPAPAPVVAPRTLAQAIPARLVMGLKFGGGGTLWSGPHKTALGIDENNATFDIPIFNETRGGYALSSGFYVQGIFFDYFGIEAGLNFVQHNLLEEVKWTYTEITTTPSGAQDIRNWEAKSEQSLSWTALHVPILVKAVIPSGTTRISLGVGPEFTFSNWSRAKFNITRGGLSSTDISSKTFPSDYPGCYDGSRRLPGSRCGLSRIGTKDRDSVYLAVVFGIEINLGDFVIPIDIHWAYNFSQPDDYLDRVDVDPNSIPQPGNTRVRPNTLSLLTRDSMYGGLRIGLGYQF